MQKLIARLLRGSCEVMAIIVTLNCSAYAPTGNPTASGVMPKVGHCAMDKLNGEWVAFGTKVIMPDGRELIVTDRFGDSRNNCLDIFMETEQECWEWGRRNVECRVELP